MIFNNPDFYPTPRSVIDKMIFGIDFNNKVILEPSAGNGAIIDVIREFMPKEILCCEFDDDLAKICSQKSDRFLANSFLSVIKEEVSHIDFIIMNPPFSRDEQHILHAWDILPEGGQIISLCNSETIENALTRKRAELCSIIERYGSYENLGNVFSNAERKTGVKVSMVKLFKPKSNDEFEGYFDLEEEYENQENGLMTTDAIKEIVSRYVGSVKMYDEVYSASEKINKLMQPITSHDHAIKFGAKYTSNQKFYSEINRDTFKVELQKGAWKSIFDKLNMQKYVTSSVMQDINKFINQQVNVPFTVKNIYKMIDLIIGTHSQRMERVIVEVFDMITKRHSENRFSLEGWKTNSEYIVNRKFILPTWDVSMGMDGKCRASYSGSNYFLDDLTKSLCYISGSNFNDQISWWDFCKELDWGTWYNFNFLKIRVYKKKTIHCEFLDEKIWIDFNRLAAKHKGFMLASKFEGNFRRKTTGMKVY